MTLIRIILIYLFINGNLQSSQATLSSKNKKSKSVNSKGKLQKGPEGPVSASVFTRNLVSEDVTWKDIVEWNKAYNQDTSKKSASDIVLGYVTPWNNHGYDVAKTFGSKFTHISPVWLQLKIDAGKGSYIITGDHDIDQGWIKNVINGGQSSRVKITPRLIFEGWQSRDFNRLVKSSSEREKLTYYLMNFLERNDIDGLVLEIWSQLPSLDLIKTMPAVIAEISRELRREEFCVILVIPPSVYNHDTPGMFRSEEFNQLVDSVDAFSLMTYDYSNFQNPGPNSPIKWMKVCVENLVPDASSPHRAKILLGLNMYGLDHSVTGGSHTFGQGYVETVSQYKPTFKFDAVSSEHYFEYKAKSGTHRVFYPTLHSLHLRIKLAEELNTGLSLWEIGQGLDYFYDLL